MASKMTVIQTAVRISTLFVLSVAFAVSGSGAPSLFPISVHGKFGYVDATGRIAIEPRFNDANNFSEHLAAVKIGNQWGFIAESGEFTIPAAFDYVCDFFHSVAAVASHGKWGVIDTTGRFTTPPQFDELDCQRNDQYLAAPLNRGEHGWRYLDTVRGEMLPLRANLPYGFKEGLTTFNVTGIDISDPNGGSSFGFMAPDGTMVIPARFVDARNFCEGLAAVKIGTRWGYIERSGDVVIQPRYDWPGCFQEGMAAVVVGKLFGFIDKTGTMLIPPTYPNVGEFSEGLATVELRSNGKWGYIDTAGRVVIKPQFDVAREFVNGIASVRVGDKNGYIDKTGRYIWAPTK